MTYQFETARCAVRPFAAGDIDAFMAYRNDAVWMRYQGFKCLSKREYEEALLCKPDLSRGVQLAVVEKKTGVLIGDLYWKLDGDACWLGYTITPAKARQGYMYEAVSAAIQSLASQGIGVFKAGVAPGNDASAALLDKLGFAYLHIQEGERVYALFL
jgi:ribosomal-protein-alanine N-acetyltransferase